MLETLTALAVLSLTMSALLDAYTTGLKGAGASERKTRANLLAQSLMTETLSRTKILPGLNSGNYKPFNWKINTALLEQMQTGKGKDVKKWGLFQISVTIGLNSQQLVSLQTVKMGKIIE